jgi:hypothetical protein
MKIIITESQFKRILSEQDPYEEFVKAGGFRNCRGIALKIFGGEDAVVDEKPRTDWQQITEDSYGYKDFRKENPELKIDEKYFAVLRHYFLQLKNTTSYDFVFNQEGKPWTPIMTQKNVNTIEGMIKNKMGDFIWLRDNFGNKKPTIQELYNFFQSIGGLKKIKEMIETTGFNTKEYLERFKKLADQYNENLMKNFPFPSPTEKTNFYIAWTDETGAKNKYRFFNTFEEFKASVDAIRKVDGIPPREYKEDGLPSSGGAVYGGAPKGPASSALGIK